MSPAERMKGETCEVDTEIEVLAENWHAVQAYVRCQHTMLAGMGGAVYLGVSSQEVRAAASMLRIPSREWPDVIDGAQALASKIAAIENAKAEARAKRK